MNFDRRVLCGGMLATVAAGAFAESGQPRTIALLFDSLTSPFWVTALEIMRREATMRGWSVLEAVSNMDDNKQYSQVQSMIQRRVNGIIIIHTNDRAVVPAIRAANAAGVPMVHFNRPPAPTDAYSVAVVADNRKLMRETVTALVEKARSLGGQYKAALLIGDLADANAVQRRAGFLDAIEASGDVIEVVAQIPTEWNADRAFAGLSNALQAHPNINMLVSSSDFLAPQVEQALRIAGKWHIPEEPGHVLIASFDGDATAYQQLSSGHFYAVGVQDLHHEVKLSFEALEQQWEGRRPPKVLVDSGFVITRENLQQKRDQMWGYSVWKAKVATDGPISPSGDAPSEVNPSSVSSSLVLGDGSQHATTGESTSFWSWAAILTALALFSRAVFSIDTWHEMLLAMLPLAILVIGQTFVLLLGHIDLSITAVMALGSIASGSLMSRYGDSLGEPWTTAGGILVFLAIGLLIGIFNGVCAAFLRMPSFIVTLAVMMLGSGAAVWYASLLSDTTGMGSLPRAFLTVGYGSVFGIPIVLILCVAVVLVAWYVLSSTLMGRWIYAAGHNTRAARISGVPVPAVTVVAFTISGACAAFASIIYTSRVETGLPTLGQNMLLDIVGAAVIGGVSLFGGRGSVLMALGGALFLSILDKSLQLLGLSLFMVLAIKGGAILAAAIVDGVRQQRRNCA